MNSVIIVWDDIINSLISTIGATTEINNFFKENFSLTMLKDGEGLAIINDKLTYTVKATVNDARKFLLSVLKYNINYIVEA